MEILPELMREQLNKIFAKASQLHNQAPFNSPIRMQCNEVMDGILKLNKNQHRIKPENYIKRGTSFISLIANIDVSMNGPESTKSHYYNPSVLKKVVGFNVVVDTENNLEDEQQDAEEVDLQENAEISAKGKRGGARAGAGRKSIGIKKSVSLSLPIEGWERIDALIKAGEFKSISHYFRSLMGYKDIY